MKRVAFSILLVAALLLGLVGTALAAPPDDHPGKGPPVFEKSVFIHYPKEFAPGKPDGTPGVGPAKKTKDTELYSYSKTHWPDSVVLNGGITYCYNPANEPGDFEAAIIASFDAWEEDPGSYVDFEHMGGTEEVPGLDVPQPDGQNIVGWADLSDDYPNAIGITIIWSYRSRSEKIIVDCDTVLNSNSYYAWTASDGQQLPDTGAYDVDVQNIMTHEAGHWLMLNDMYYDAASEQTMYGYASDAELKKRSLEDGDLAGVRRIYGE
ncbi:MAG TPA: hypothetical protein G4O07_06210 [Dehalococcoidia bacterium]|nr:hypothetical protein [Dehalococcoidia bacterium]